MQIIQIDVKDKVASTDFDEVVSFNSVYRLKFSFDEEWSDFENRVAVVLWAGGCAETLFQGDECEMPQVRSCDSEYALIGAYSIDGEKRIASSFVRVRCRAGAHGVPQGKPVQSLHDQILSFLNEKDWSIFEEKVAQGIYSAVRVNRFGLVTGGGNIVEVGREGQPYPSSKLVAGGIFFRCREGIYTPCYFTGTSVEPLAMSGSALGHTLTLGSKTYDGSEDVTVTGDDLGLAEVAVSGSYNDLTDKPSFLSEVTSVNGKKGEVVLSGDDLGLARVATSGSFNDLTDAPDLNSVVTSVNGQTGKVVISKNDLDLARVAITGSYEDLKNKPNLDSTVTSVNGQSGDVVISKNDLDLARVAITGSYDDLKNKPNLDSTVTSVNGQSGDVVISKNDLDLARVAITGSYVDLTDRPNLDHVVTSVNGQSGAVVISKNDLDLSKVAITGKYADLLEKPSLDALVTSVNGQSGEVVISKNDLGLAEVAITGSYNDLSDKPSFESAVTSVNGQTGAVVISKNDLDLAQVAITGSYNDLKNRPDLDSVVTSVNGQSGAVVISKNDLALGKVANVHQMPLENGYAIGQTCNELLTTGFYRIKGMENSSCANAPTSRSNTSISDCDWAILVLAQHDGTNNVTQIAFSERNDCAIRVRNLTDGTWCAWKSVI